MKKLIYVLMISLLISFNHEKFFLELGCFSQDVGLGQFVLRGHIILQALSIASSTHSIFKVLATLNN